MNTTGRVLLLVVGVLVFVTILRMVGARHLRSKYALLWICVGPMLLPPIVFPDLADRAGRAVGVESGLILALFGGFIILLFVSMHFSWELSKLEVRTRVLAEELALLRNQVDAQKKAAENTATDGGGDDIGPNDATSETSG